MFYTKTDDIVKQNKNNNGLQNFQVGLTNIYTFGC